MADEGDIYQVRRHADHRIGQVAMKMAGERVLIFTGKGQTHLPLLGELAPGNFITIEVFDGVKVTVENRTGLPLPDGPQMDPAEFLHHVAAKHSFEVLDDDKLDDSRRYHRHLHDALPQDHEHEAW